MAAGAAGAAVVLGLGATTGMVAAAVQRDLSESVGSVGKEAAVATTETAGSPRVVRVVTIVTEVPEGSGVARVPVTRVSTTGSARRSGHASRRSTALRPASRPPRAVPASSGSTAAPPVHTTTRKS